MAYLPNLKKHFSKFHSDVYKGNPVYPCKANEAWFLLDDDEEDGSSPPLAALIPIVTMDVPTTPPSPSSNTSLADVEFAQIVADRLLEVCSMDGPGHVFHLA